MSETSVSSYWITRSGDVGSIGDWEALFPYWSFAKTIIAACALRLAEKGQLDLDVSLKGQAYTMRQLLANTSGLGDYGGLSAYKSAVERNERPWTRDRLLEHVPQDRLKFGPGQGWSYSNVGYMIAKEQLEDLCACPMANIVDDLIARPLGLKSLFYPASPEELATCPFRTDQYHPGWVYHGLVLGSASEAAQILRAILEGGLLQDEARHMMTRARPLSGAIDGRPWTKTGYALGLMSGEMGELGRAVGHSGVGPFSVSSIYHFPDVVDPITIASFAPGSNEAVTEYEVVRIAGSHASKLGKGVRQRS